MRIRTYNFLANIHVDDMNFFSSFKFSRSSPNCPLCEMVDRVSMVRDVCGHVNQLRPN